MSSPFHNHADAARGLIGSGADLGRRAGQFCGGIIFDPALTEKQRSWLVGLLKRHKLPPLEDGGWRMTARIRPCTGLKAGKADGEA